ncbi:MAG: threonine synthase [Chloroflexi bacterium]|nr:threonine synthase [Chloroflexota bacterium]
MLATNLRCVNCGSEYPLELIYSCPNCGDILDVEYDYSSLQAHGLRPADFPGFWRYLDLLPIDDPSSIVSLGEGGTELIRSERLGAELGMENLYVKNETTNPTGSFKDRPSCLGVSKAQEMGARTVVCASSGNAAVAVSAYAARAGLKSVLFVPETTPPGKLAQGAIFGAEVVRVKGPYSESYRAAKQVCERYSLPNLTSTFINPFLVEADKTLAYEVSEALGGKAPDYMLIPIGAGPLLAGCYKGFQEFELLGLGHGLPHMIGVQASNCAPTARAFKRGANEVEAWEEGSKTACSGIADQLRGYSQDGTLTLKVIRKSGGVAIDLPDEESLAAVRLLARTEGIFAEPTGAIGVAALKRLAAQKAIDPKATVVCVVTGHGLKDPSAAVRMESLSEPIDADKAGGIDFHALYL